MPTNYTGVASAITNRNAPTISEPAGGDAPNAASVNTPLNALTDQVASLKAYGAILALPNQFSGGLSSTSGAGGPTPITGTLAAAAPGAVVGDGSTYGVGVLGKSSGTADAIKGDASGGGGAGGEFVRGSGRGAICLTPVAGDPSSPQNGDIWYNSTTNTLRCFVGGAIKTITIA